MGALIARARQVLLTPLAVALAAGFACLFVAAMVLVPILRDRAAEAPLGGPQLQISAADLQSLAPSDLAGLGRTVIKVQAADGMTVPALALDARYQAGAKRLDLKIVHSPELERVIGFGGPATTEYDRKSDGGYQRRWRSGDSIELESFDRETGAVTYGQVRGEFYVMARGEGGVTLEDVRAAVGRFGDPALQGLKRGG